MITAKEARELSSRMPIDAENDLRKIEAEIKIHASQGDHVFGITVTFTRRPWRSLKGLAISWKRSTARERASS